MELSVDFDFIRSQKLLLIPQLKQALKILGMNSRELYSYAEKQRDTNSIIEIVPQERQAYFDDSDDDEECVLTGNENTVTLKEHLLFQLDSSPLDRMQRRIGEYLIDNTDANGYINIQIREVAAFFNIPAALVHKVMSFLQGFDPPGICARNLKECLNIQLSQMENASRTAMLVVNKYLNKLAENNIEAVVIDTGLDFENVSEAFKLIRMLEPRPGREFYSNEELRTAVADVTIRNIGRQYLVVLNEDVLPEINISEEYRIDRIADKIADKASDNIAGKGIIKEKLRNAIWLIKCIEQRKNIILQIAQYIVKEQYDFFDKGTAYFKAIKKRHLERDLNMHESILIEALRDKYLHCRWGLFEFSYFIK